MTQLTPGRSSRHRHRLCARTAVVAGTLALLALPSAVAGQQANDPLAPIVAEALRNNLGLAQAGKAVERADAGVREARGRFFPSLTLDSRYSEQHDALNVGDFVNPAYAALNQMLGENRFPTNLDLTLPLQHESRLRLIQPVFDASILAAYSQSRHAREGQVWQRRATARRLAAQAQAAYLNTAAARQARLVWEATLELVTENERVAQRLVAAGRATPDAVYRARAERSDVTQRLAEAREAEDAAGRAFNQVLRRDLQAPVEQIPDSLLRFEWTLSESEAVASALARREDLPQVAAGIRAAEAGVRLASASFLPTVSIALDYGFQGQELSFTRENDFAMASVVFSWNLFRGGSDAARRSGAKAEAERLRLQHEELEDLIRLDVHQAYEAAVVARDAIATAEAQRAAAQRTFDLVRRRYDEGMASQVEFLDARTALTSAELNRVLTQYRAAIRYVDLERAAALRPMDRTERN